MFPNQQCFLALQVSPLVDTDYNIHLDNFLGILLSQYIYQDSKLLVLVVFFAELVQTGLWAVWAEQHAL